MSTGYKELFNSVLQKEEDRRTAKQKMNDEVEANMIELDNILSEVINSEQFAHTSVEYIEEDRLICFECHSNCLEIKLTEDYSELRIADKVVSFVDDEAKVEYSNEAIYFVTEEDGEVIYDAGADYQSKEQMFSYVVERAATIVSKGE